MNPNADFIRRIRHLEQQIAQLRQTEIPQAYAAAINYTANRARTQIVLEMKNLTQLRPGILRKKIYLNRAKKDKLRSFINIYTSRIRLSSTMPTRLKNSPNTKGHVLVVHGVAYPGAFIRKSTHSGLWDVYRRVGREQYPIRPELINILGAADQAIITTREQRGLYTIFRQRVEHELNFRLGRLQRGRSA